MRSPAERPPYKGDIVSDIPEVITIAELVAAYNAIDLAAGDEPAIVAYWYGLPIYAERRPQPLAEVIDFAAAHRRRGKVITIIRKRLADVINISQYAR